MIQDGMHHFNIRKRIHKKHEPYPHHEKWKRFVDKAIYVAIIFGLVMTIPQVTRIWFEKNAAGVSVLSWSAYMLIAIFWLMYGFIHQEKPIIVTNILWILMDIFIVVGIFIYG